MMKMPQKSPLTVDVSSNIAEDLYYAFSVRGAALSDNRPIWNINITVDPISFYVGAIGSVSLGYILNQYEPRNIDNIAYINEQGETQGNNFLIKVIRHTFSYPLTILQRFFLGGALYVLIGLATHRYLKRGRPLACGAITGLYFGYDSPFTAMIKATAGFATFAIIMEELVNLGLKS